MAEVVGGVVVGVGVVVVEVLSGVWERFLQRP